jgi:hypothetical protein
MLVLCLMGTIGFGSEAYNPPERLMAVRPTFDGQTQRPLRYHPDGTDFVIENGEEFFNRPLYGPNTAFRADAGDKPEFSLYLPGRGGNLRLGIRTSKGAKWLHEAAKILARYRPGEMIYDIRDPWLGDGVLHLAAITQTNADGLLVQAELRGSSEPVELIWAFGGASGEKGSRGGDIGCESEPVSRYFQLRPQQCRDNAFKIEGNRFTLKSKTATIDGIMPDGAKLSVADANKWAVPGELLTGGSSNAELPVVVGSVALPDSKPVYLGLQSMTGKAAAQSASDLSAAFAVAEQQRQARAGKVVVDTPDPFINAAAAALCIAADGVWDEASGTVQHGAVAWRTKLLGWRGPYSCDALGWHDRAARHLTYWAGRQDAKTVPDAILPADLASNLSRNEPSLHSNGDMSRSHYDMNLVYIDALLRHLLWTGDLDMAQRLWPVIERHLAWERRLFRRPFGADGLPLYEAYAAIWASDDLQYSGGGAAHTSAYNYYHNRMAARLAKILGKDPTPYEHEAELILKAMRRELWLPDQGWYAEWKDILGLKQVHPNAALWTVYHTIDSQVPTTFEAWQMTRFVDTQIAHIPIWGPGVPEGDFFTLPTTSWMPYTWSTNNVVMAEAAHTALAYWQAGRNDTAFNLFKGCILDSMYLGLCPGNVGMCTYFDMARGESQRDFADGIGACSRTLIEGLFGVQPDMLAGELRIDPGLPAQWDQARLQHPDLDFIFERQGLTETYAVTSIFAKPMALCLTIPALRDSVAGVAIDGRPASWELVQDAIGLPHIRIRAEAAQQHKIAITWQGDTPAKARGLAIVARGQPLSAEFGSATLLEVADPQKSLVNPPTTFVAAVSGSLGHHTAFAHVRQGQMTWWLPVPFEVRPAYETVASAAQDAEHLRFRIRNNTSQAIEKTRVSQKIPPYSVSDEIALPADGLLAGTNVVSVELGDGHVIQGTATNWSLKPVDARVAWDTVDLTGVFNDNVTRIFQNDYLSPRSPYCSLAIPKQGIGSWCNFQKSFEVDDRGLRAAADRNQGKLVLPQGIPFKTPGVGDVNNTAFVSQWDNYPKERTVPLSGRASRAYLLMAGSTNSMQSRFDNGEVIVAYADGSTERLALHNPTNWWPIDQDYYIDDYAFERPDAIPPRVDLRTGAVRVLDAATFKGKGGTVRGGAATVLDIPLSDKKDLKSVTVRALANEVVIGLMAVTLARPGTVGANDDSPLRAVQLRCEYAENAPGVDVPQPRLFWTLKSSVRGQRQTAYRILVASSQENLAAGKGDLWDSGKTASDETIQIRYGGAALASSQRVFWKVQVWDKDGKPSPWSAEATWTMGLLNEADWQARWIGSASESPTLLLRREFIVKSGLARAIVHVCGLGQYELTLNGNKVGNDLLSPGWSKYDKTCLYDTYDLTPLLKPGANSAGLLLGNGMYNVKGGRYTKFKGSFGPLKAICHIRLEYTDGTTEIIGTDNRWQVSSGPITFSCVYGGEDYDARMGQDWASAAVVDGPGGKLRGLSCAAAPIHSFEVLKPAAVKELGSGVAIYDMGQNAAIMPRFVVKGPAGSSVRLTPAELLKNDGTLDRRSVGGGQVYWQYTLAGTDAESWFPKFFYHGCRYIQVDRRPAEPNGPLPNVQSLEGLVVHSDAEPVGRFACSNDLFNRIHTLIRWAQRSNLASVITDCPHRERLGWLEQYHLNGPSLRYEFDLARMFAKGMNDMADSQLDNGLIPDIAPEYTAFSGGFRDSPEWGSAFILVPWQQYEWTGDLQLLERYYEPMKRYVAYLGGKATNHIVSHGLGDWYDIGPARPGVAQLTPIALTATAFYYNDVWVLAQTARLLGKSDDAKTFESLASEIRAAFNKTFFNAETGRYATGSQSANSIPLVMGLVEPANRGKVLDAIVQDVEKHGNAVTAGDVGYRYLLRALAEGGRSDVIFAMNNQSDKPGYGYQLKMGATSLTEAWNADPSSSQNHFMLGQIMEWFYHDLAGIGCEPNAAGFKKIVIRPQPVGDVNWVEASFKSIRGQIVSNWKRQAGEFTLNVTIPAGASATVYLPCAAASEITESGKPAPSSPGVRLVRREEHRAVYAIDSGAYTFQAKL